MRLSLARRGMNPRPGSAASGGGGGGAAFVGGTLTEPLVLVASGSAAAGLNVTPGSAPTSPANGDHWTTGAGAFYRIGGTTYELMFKAGGTFTGPITLPASASGGAALTLPHGADPSAPSNGNVWTKTDGFYVRLNGTTARLVAATELYGRPGAPIEKTGAFTFALSDRGSTIYTTSGSAHNATVPPNSSVAFPVGTILEGGQYGAGTTTFVPGSGVTIRSEGSKLKTYGQYSRWSLEKLATDEWWLAGSLKT